MNEIDVLPIPGYEKVIEIKNQAVGLHAFVAIHSTAIGPSLGGVRMYPYPTREQALEDALRLSKAMSYKSALAETGLGGGKSVIIGSPKIKKTEALLLAFGEALNSLNGSYIGAEDVGTNTQDMLIIRKTTPFVAALPTKGSSGDPSRFTAYGIYRGMQAVAQTLWGSPSLKDRVIAIQGLGNVGLKTAHFLFWEGARLILTDLDQELLEETARLLGADKVKPEEILSTPCDLFAPCALGGVLNSKTIPLLKCSAVAGSANNQLEKEEDGTILQQRGILYAVDYAINAGGIINAACEYEAEGYSPRRSRDKTERIFDTLIHIFEKSIRENTPTNLVANILAEYKLSHHPQYKSHP